MTYHEYIASREWRQNAARLAELETSGFRYRLCSDDGAGSALEVHHRTYENLGNEVIEIFEIAGLREGLGDWRPKFGKFSVIQLE